MPYLLDFNTSVYRLALLSTMNIQTNAIVKMDSFSFPYGPSIRETNVYITYTNILFFVSDET